ncbi:hypothetical protein [Algoriphagus antarcticus]|uniref:SPOR domain-containing protein n=1 Tax=Algoriphagus antarcticus TaxID=238540 RepID=A0A3E0DW73_9BACT|nr:hypothetical protein [Algoriphagus antarcticus]REG90324.1 hypothetical protein C8N25_10763 [Algoriphagus antarcticus]
MNGKTEDYKQWTDPKDYGLPFVEVVPLSQASISKKEDEISAPIDVAEVKKKTIHAVRTSVVERQESTKSESKIEEKKSNNSWIWIAAVFTVAVVIVIIWQMNKSVIPASDSGEIFSDSTEGLASQENDEVAINSTPSKETQTSDIQSTISDSISSVSPASISAQTGTTIASRVSGTLVRVTEKADRAQFYIIVGSLPNEAMALKEAEQYKDRAEKVYLILPYEDVTNYRLAIGTSRGWTAINEELALVKDQYTEELWILKY